MHAIGQLIGVGAVGALFTLFMTENERVARACVGYLKATALVVTGLVVVVLAAGVR